MLISCFISQEVLAWQASPQEKIKQLKSTADFNPQSTTYIDLLLDIASRNIHADSAAFVIKEAYNLSLDNKYRKGESRALKLYGRHYTEKGDDKKAYKYFLKALEIANSHELFNQKIGILSQLGHGFANKSDDENAINSYLEALGIAEKYKRTDKIAALNNQIAVMYQQNDDNETALLFFEKVRKYSIAKNKQKLLGYVLANMMVINRDKGNFTEAECLINASIQAFEKLESKKFLIYGYRGKAGVFYAKKNFEIALKWYLKAEKLCNELDYDIGRLLTYRGLGNSYLKLQDLEAAEHYALSALQISKKIRDTMAIQKLDLLFSKIYNKKGLHKKAYDHLTEYNLNNEESLKKGFNKGLGVLRSKIEFNNQKKVLVEENNNALAKQKNYVYLALAALLIMSLFLILIFRTHKLQKKFTAQLSDSNATKDKLFSVIAHDLKGPINSFYSLMKLYMDKEFSKEETQHLFPKAMDDIHNISEMLNNLLLWAKTQMQGSTIKQQNIDVNRIACDNVLLLNPLAEKKNIKIINAIPVKTFSFSDRDHIDIVLRNLISNAIKFTNSNGEINISATEHDNELQIAVSDNGVGMDLETQSKLFEKNNTKSTYGTNNEKGTGLGLALCKDMVESNGGEIRVSSVKDKGTTIYFTLLTKQEYLKAV